MVVDVNGIPIEFSFTPGSVTDIKALRNLPLNLPEGSILLGDRAYTDYCFEDYLEELEKIRLLAKRKTNLKRQHSQENTFLLKTYRNRVETVFSSITSRMPSTLSSL